VQVKPIAVVCVPSRRVRAARIGAGINELRPRNLPRVCRGGLRALFVGETLQSQGQHSIKRRRGPACVAVGTIFFGWLDSQANSLGVHAQGPVVETAQLAYAFAQIGGAR
jgi:hypothetical protein